MSLSVDLKKTLGSFALDLSFEAGNGVTALLGASGSGKSMTCRCIAGIEKPDRGRIVLGGKTLYDSGRHICLSPQQRKVGYLFQQYALFPNMTAEQNVLCGLRRRKAENARDLARTMLSRVRMAGYENRYPRQMSGGQQQRVALARMLVNEPEILLLDEPFSALDAHLRYQMQNETMEILRAFGKPVLLVSHDRDEVYRLCDHIAIVNRGRIEAYGEKHAVFADPKTVWGARLTGCKNISRLEFPQSGQALAVDWGISLPAPAKKAAAVGIRMHDLCPQGGENAVLCQVVEEIENPFSVTVRLRPRGRTDTVPLGMELSKEQWAAIRCELLPVGFPGDKLLWLEDSENET